MQRRHRTENNHSKNRNEICAQILNLKNPSLLLTNTVLNIKYKIIYFALQEDAKLNHLVTIPGALERFLLINILSRALTWHKKIITNLQLDTRCKK